MNKALIIFAKEPVPGRVKTRLARDVGEQAAAELYSAMLDDVMAKAALLEDVRLLVFWATKEGEFPLFPAIPRLEMFEQHGADLGERMANAFMAAFEEGVEECCIIGSDLPDLPHEYLRQAFRTLEDENTDTVLGPCSDGGYYLLGMRRFCSRLFEDVPWSTSQVLKTTLERARESGLAVELLPEWHDIDTLEDLRRLALSSGKAPRTRAMLKNMPSIINALTASGDFP